MRKILMIKVKLSDNCLKCKLLYDLGEKKCFILEMFKLKNISTNKVCDKNNFYLKMFYSKFFFNYFSKLKNILIP